ncbi:pyridoxamine 5'-phosphate oxidase [Polluticaenibacter yanchengensis]|uniref:Pyridoxine/pyridoxamine 5'-phosphate oxidase n=1 Tax=Polluticaenibacter yanchengensis TaxID=3014562 RepID=A0ABT4UPI8_9BACT|nr:pyridoxamine 5'-phosphate oxidase [Chitinophagaceae bacterium LY-5]
MSNIADIRTDYMMADLVEAEASQNAIEQFAKWWKQAQESRIEEINAMTLCTVGADLIPQGRIVLLKGFSDKGFEFYTNYQSNKGKELLAYPNASLVFFWKELQRQVRITGTVEKLSIEESTAYYHSRPRGSQLGAWASAQSTVIENRQVLSQKLSHFQQEYEGTDIPKPEYWGGYKVVPRLIEFWQGRPNRLHDRLLYTKADNNNWKIERLSP